jgi:hypothetical protein
MLRPKLAFFCAGQLRLALAPGHHQPRAAYLATPERRTTASNRLSPPVGTTETSGREILSDRVARGRVPCWLAQAGAQRRIGSHRPSCGPRAPASLGLELLEQPTATLNHGRRRTRFPFGCPRPRREATVQPATLLAAHSPFFASIAP